MPESSQPTDPSRRRPASAAPQKKTEPPTLDQPAPAKKPAKPPVPPQPKDAVPPSNAQPPAKSANQEATVALPPSAANQQAAKKAPPKAGHSATLPAPPVKKPAAPPTAAFQVPTVDLPGKSSQPPAATLSRGPGGSPGDSVPNLDLPGDRDFGDYELLEEVARGGMGVIFKARQKSLNRIVALKMILAGQLASKEQVRRFLIEAEEAGKLDHAHIVPIYQVGEHNHQHYFSMKLIEGGNLSQAIKRLKAKPKAAARLVSLIAEAVHYAHQRGILHRDLKPGNILVDQDGQPHITDFGLAKPLDHEGARTQSGAIVGTPSYMSPEQASGRKDLSIAVDIYGTGAILFELLTGQPPFTGDSPVEIILKVINEEAPTPRSLNPKIESDLETICVKCLQKDPAKRYATAAALGEDLSRFLTGEPIQARPVTRTERAVRWVKRRPAWAALLAVSAAAAFALLIGGWIHNGTLQAALGEAEKQRSQAEHNAAEANRQRDLVKSNFDHRLDVIDDMVLKVDRRLANLDGMESVRGEFLHELLQLSLGLLQEKPDDTTVQRQTARLYAALGDVERDLGDLAKADESYARARDLLLGLARQSDNYDDRYEAIAVYRKHADLLAENRRWPEAITASQEVLAQVDQLANDFPQKPQARLQAASTLFQIGNLLEETRQSTEAEKTYRQALERQEALIQQFPSNARVHMDLAATAASLASLLDGNPKSPPESRVLWERAHKAWLNAFELTPQSSAVSNGLFESYNDLLGHYRKRGLHEEIAALGLQWSQVGTDPSADPYNGACLLSAAVRVAEGQTGLKPEDKTRLVNGYAGQALQLLTKAMQAGFKDRPLLDRDPDLDPLRQREDFRSLMADVDKRLPGQPPTPGSELAQVVRDYEDKVKQFDRAVTRARTAAEKRKAQAQQPQLEPVGRRLLDMAKDHPEVPTVVDALGWLADKTIPETGQQSPVLLKLQEETLQLIERDHFSKPAMATLCPLLAASPSKAGDSLLRKLVDKHPQADVRGLACYGLARSLASQWTKARVRGPADDLSRQAEEQYERVIKDFADVSFGQTTLRDAAESRLFEFRHLMVGRPAQEIVGEDIAGKTFKLSDHRGQVVVLSFWAHWCGYCRQLYPHEREMVQRLKGQPFVLLGVNSDANRAEVTRVQQKEAMTWRSWWSQSGQGGSIQEQWQVDSYPTLYVLDHKGVIRYKDLRGPQLDKAVDRLLAEMKADKGTVPQ